MKRKFTRKKSKLKLVFQMFVLNNSVVQQVQVPKVITVMNPKRNQIDEKTAMQPAKTSEFVT